MAKEPGSTSWPVTRDVQHGRLVCVGCVAGVPVLCSQQRVRGDQHEACPVAQASPSALIAALLAVFVAPLLA